MMFVAKWEGQVCEWFSQRETSALKDMPGYIFLHYQYSILSFNSKATSQQ